MRKRVNEDRENKVWCMGVDLKLLQAISYPDEEWEYVQRLVDEPLGDCYLVSNMGRVFNTGKQELCRLYPDKEGTKYIKVSLEQCPEGHKNYNVHQLVALAFVINPDPGRKVRVHHVDVNQENNKANNLLWLSTVEHGTAHSLKNNDLAQYCEQVAEWRKEHPIRTTGKLIALKAFEEDEQMEEEPEMR